MIDRSARNMPDSLKSSPHPFFSGDNTPVWTPNHCFIKKNRKPKAQDAPPPDMDVMVFAFPAPLRLQDTFHVSSKAS